MNRIRKIGITLFLSLLAAFGPAKLMVQAAEERIVLAVVNGEEITTDQLLAELGRIHSGQEITNRGDFDVERIVDRLINNRLMIQDARLLELDQESNFREEVDNFHAGAALDQFRTDALRKDISVSDDEIAAYFVAEFRQVRFFLLTLSDKAIADSLKRVLRPDSQLAMLAPMFPQDAYKFGNGDRGLTYWNTLEPGVRAELQEAMPGEICGPFPRRSGFAFVQLLEERPADTTQLASHHNRIRAVLSQQQKRRTETELIEHLKQKYPVAVDDSTLQRVLKPDAQKDVSWDSTQVIVARVGNRTITAANLLRKLRHANPQDHKAYAMAVENSLNDLVTDRLFQLEAQAQDYRNNPAVLQEVQTFEDSLLLVTYLEQVVSPKLVITEAAIDSFYQANKDRFRNAPDVRISQITVTSADRATMLLNRLQAGADFSWIVKEYSTDEYAAREGDRGWLNAGIFPQPMRSDLENTPVGQIVGPYPGDDGFMLWKIVDRRPGEIRDLPAMRGYIRQQLIQIQFTRTMDNVLEKLRKDAQITIDHEAISRLVLGGSSR